CAPASNRATRLTQRHKREFVRIFLPPLKPGLLAIDSQPQIVFVPHCDLSCPQAPLRSLGKSQHHMNVVIQAPPGDERTHVGCNLLAGQTGDKACEIEGVSSNVAERSSRPTPRRICPPLRLLLSGSLKRSGEPVLHILDLH